MRKKIRTALLIISCAVLLCGAAGMLLAGALGGMGLFGFIQKRHMEKLPGNSDKYGFDAVEPLENSPLKGRRVCVLGSSVVFGSASRGYAVAEYLGRRFGCEYTKEAVCGTTLVDSGAESYIKRMERLDKNVRYDLFICQLSTNDATQMKPLGDISSGGDPDTSAVTGAVEHIIRYAESTWGCPVVFFTGSRYGSERYGAMVDRLKELKEIYGVGVIDLWSDDGFNALPDERRALYMHDGIHPTMAGYRDWWGPEMERQLVGILKTDGFMW